MNDLSKKKLTDKPRVFETRNGCIIKEDWEEYWSNGHYCVAYVLVSIPESLELGGGTPRIHDSFALLLLADESLPRGGTWGTGFDVVKEIKNYKETE